MDDFLEFLIVHLIVGFLLEHFVVSVLGQQLLRVAHGVWPSTLVYFVETQQWEPYNQKEREKAVVRELLFGEQPFSEDVKEINRWLEVIGRRDLTVSGDEIVKMILF